MSFRCVVVTPEQQTLDEKVSQVILPAHDGQIGVLSNRSPLLVELGIGQLRVDLAAGGQPTTYFVDGGFAQMKDNVLTVLTKQAIPADKIDLETAKAKYAEAEASKPTDAKGIEERQRELARGRAKQQIARR
ncbi:MAG TPA: ATP synthase F1 subunit epsilon [Humisphaera sp.]|jgi:F-type H+-transporting ATPase subunit epsilon|nr:ATP synthase F1 subunit epsilon [Humisphaera sp.]